MTSRSKELCEWTVSGMDCGACAAKISKAVERLPGVSEVSVGLMAERLKVSVDITKNDAAAVEKTVRKLGYDLERRQSSKDVNSKSAKEETIDQVHSSSTHDHDRKQPHTEDHSDEKGHVHDNPADRGKAWYATSKGRLVIGTGILLAIAWGIELFTGSETGKWAFVIACLIALVPVARRAFAALSTGQPFTIEMLMTIAATGALFIDAAEEAALVVFLFAVGELLEGVAANRARDGIRALARLVPKTAMLEIAGQFKEVSAESLKIDQIILVRPGDRIAADGEIIDGNSGLDESPVTGESIPVAKGPGDDVFAGSINTEAALRVRVTKTAEDNTISRIIQLVEEAESARAPTERFIDQFSRWYMPAIVTMAILVVLIPPLGFGGDWSTWIYRGLALLLIGCPCALVISVPASIASALSSGARRGLLFKGGTVIEAAAKTSFVAFDKTGTLTHGRPEVTDIVPFEKVSEKEILEVAAGVEAGSSHPLARAILMKAESSSIPALAAKNAKILVGQGVEAVVGGKKAWVVSPKFAHQNNVIDDQQMQLAAEFELQGKTAVIVYRQKMLLGLIAMRDEARADSREGIEQLTALGVQSTILTGDNERTAEAIAGGLGMKFRANMMPEDKLAEIKAMSASGGVMMIGDGINDAPALKQADVGVAMGSGTDVALETADAAILRDRVTDVAATIRLARTAMSNIRQNITIALGLKAIFLVTTVFGMTGLWIAILADTGATVIVTLNALRLLAYDPTTSTTQN